MRTGLSSVLREKEGLFAPHISLSVTHPEVHGSRETVVHTLRYTVGRHIGRDTHLQTHIGRHIGRDTHLRRFPRASQARYILVRRFPRASFSLLFPVIRLPRASQDCYSPL